MPRSREFKPEAVLDAALDLFWRKGYKACSMADVVRKSGVARYGLYQAFKDKDQLYCAALKRYQQKLHDIFIKPFCNSKADYASLVEHFDIILDQLEHGPHDGCFAHQAAIERAGKDADVNTIVNGIFDEIKDGYRTVIQNGIADGQIRSLPVEDLVVYVMGIQRAVIAMTKQNCSLEECKDYVRCALKLLQPEEHIAH
jgi:TetR/AcrR family transcriptional repressor of nem operon